MRIFIDSSELIASTTTKAMQHYMDSQNSHESKDFLLGREYGAGEWIGSFSKHFSTSN